MALTATFGLAHATVLDIQSSHLTKITMGINRLIDVKHEDAVLRNFILFVQTARVVLKYTDAHLYRKTRLSTIKLIVLRVLASNNGVMKPSEIAEWTQTERHNITALIDRMRQEGLVAAERNTRHGSGSHWCRNCRQFTTNTFND